MSWRLRREEGGEPGRGLRAPESRWTFSGALPTHAAHATFLPDWGHISTFPAALGPSRGRVSVCLSHHHIPETL